MRVNLYPLPAVFSVRKRCVRLLCVAYCVALPQTAFTQQAINESDPVAAENSSEQLPTLNIEADATAPVGNVEHADFAGRYTRIEAQALIRTEIDLAETLAFESGIQRQQIGGYGSFSSISVRASTPAQTGIFLDGVRLNGASNAVIDLSAFDSRSFNSVDVYRGAAPLQLGATNLGGAINLNSLAASANVTQIKLSAGSFNTLQTHLSHRSKHGAWQTVATAEAGQSDNDFKLVNDNGTPLNPSDDQREPRYNASVKSYSVLGKLAYQHSKSTVSDVLFQHSQRDSGVPEFRNAEFNEASYSEGRGQLHLSRRHQGPSGWNRQHRGFLQWADDHYDDSLSQVGLGAQNFRSQQRVIGASTYWDQFTQNGKWALTADLRQDNFDSEDPLGRDLSVNASRYSATAGVAYTRFALNEKLLITPRLRIEQHDSQWSQKNVQNDAEEKSAIVNPELSIRFDQDPSLIWTASVGRYYRLPTFSEMFGTQGLVVGNDELNPERGVNSELGVQWLPRDELNIRATLFHSDREDTIVSVRDAQGIGRNLNTGAASITGLELESVWQATKELHIKTNLTFQDTVNRSDIATFFNKQLPNQSATSLYARSSYDINRQWQIWGDINFAKDRFYDLGNFLPAKDATTSNIGVNWQHNALRASITLVNITNQSVEDFYGFPKPGRSAHLSVLYRLQ